MKRLILHWQLMFFSESSFITEEAFTMEIEGERTNLGRFFICKSCKFIDIACVSYDSKKWHFIVDFDFFYEVKNGYILKILLGYIDFLCAISENEYAIDVPLIGITFINGTKMVLKWYENPYVKGLIRKSYIKMFRN